MAVIDYDKKEVNAKIVYYGPGLSGKTSNIHYIYSKLMSQHRGELMTLSTKSHRTLFFDFLPVELGEVKGLNTRFFLYTVPGQVFYNNLRQQVLKDVDGIVFVADSQEKIKNENIQSFKNLEENLAEQGRSLKDIPYVIQYNKRDMPDIMSLEDLHRQLNKYNAPFFESVALNGDGVLKTLTTISKMVLKQLREGGTLQTKDAQEGPEATYGLSDDFISMTVEEAEKLKSELGPPTAVPAEGGTDSTPPLPETEPAPVQAAVPPTPAPAQAAPPVAPEPAPVAAPAASPPTPPAPPPSPLTPTKTPAAIPGQAPPLAAEPAPSAPPQSSGQLLVARWGDPQISPGGILKVPVVFMDEVTGSEYNSTITIQMTDLVPGK